MDLDKKSKTKYIESNVNYIFFGHGLFSDYIYCYLNADKILPDSPSLPHLIMIESFQKRLKQIK